MNESIIAIIDGKEKEITPERLERLHKQCPYYETKCNDLQCLCVKYEAWKDVQDPVIVNRELKELKINESDMFALMYAIQKHFASRFHNTDTITKEITDKWVKEYCICMEDEIEEIYDYISFPTVNRIPALKDNQEELRKEIIDVLHFVMNIMIVSGFKPEEAKNRWAIDHGLFLKDFDLLSEMFKEKRKILKDRFGIKNVNFMFIEDRTISDVLLTLTCELLEMNRELRQQISWKHWKKPNESINYPKLYDVCYELLNRFILLTTLVFISGEDIKTTYVKKNIENIRRQKRGY
jgi:dimeric dUTPase (all-alpha-NTP-PPase superfamily)